MEHEDFYEAEHFYNDEIDKREESDEAGTDEEDLSGLGYFELAKRFLGKRELPKVVQATSDSHDVQKNIYVQVSAITNMTDDEVHSVRQVNGQIRVRGKNCPRPILNFAQAGLPEALSRYLSKKEIERPFPIQMQVIPALLCGRDLIGIAQTGSGKTLAFVLPMLKHVLAQPPLKYGDGPIALIVAPTRELALQIQKEISPLANLLKLRSVCAYGGAQLGPQMSQLKAQCEILVATPGRLVDVLTASNGKVTNLRRVSFMVLDEADRMLDAGFEPQVSMVLSGINAKRQLSMFSATFPPHVESLARKHLQKPLEIVIGGGAEVGPNIQQNICVIKHDSDRLLKTLQLLGEWTDHGSIIIFTQTKDEVDSLFTLLLKHGYPCLTIHGGQDQHDRDSTIEDFKRRKPPNILIATSVAARGLDVKHCILVINYKPPEHLEDYIHRVGRTGRGNTIGFAYTLITPDEKDKAPDLIEALKSSGNQQIPQALVELAKQYETQVSLGLAQKRRKWGGFLGGSGFKFDSSEKSRQQKDKIAEVEKNIAADLNEDEANGQVIPQPPSAPAPASVAPNVIPPPPGMPRPPPGPPPKTSAPEPRPPSNAPKAPPPPPAMVKAPSGALALVSSTNTSSSALVKSSGPGFLSGPNATVDYLMNKLGGVVPVPAAPQGMHVEIFEINEYPELARAKGVTRDIRTQIEDRHGVRVVVKGQYIPPDSPVPLGARKLFVEISGPNKNSVVRAKRDVFQSVEEVAIRTLNIPEDRLRPKKRIRMNI
jgi:ATP-dependent RNA helicase DDX46/PRP5